MHPFVRCLPVALILGSSIVLAERAFETAHTSALAMDFVGISGDGRYLAYLSPTSLQFEDSFISRIDRDTQEKVSHRVPLSAANARLSPDGNRVAWFHSDDWDSQWGWWNGDRPGLFVFDFQTGERRGLFNGLGDPVWRASTPHFSDDGELLLFKYASQLGPATWSPVWDLIVLVDIPTGEVRVIDPLVEFPQLQPDTHVYSVALSADGGHVYLQTGFLYGCSEICFGSGALSVLNLVDGSLTRVCDRDDECTQGQISPDGDNVTYADRQDLFNLDLASGQSTLLRSLSGHSLRQAIRTRQGDRFLFKSSQFADGETYAPGRVVPPGFREGRGVQYFMYDQTKGQETLVSALSNYQVLDEFPEFAGMTDSGDVLVFVHRTVERNPGIRILLRTVGFEFNADAAVAGLWYEQGQPNKGVSLHVSTTGQSILTWLGVDPQGRPLWIMGQGELQDNRLLTDAFTIEGSAFPPYFNADEVTRIPWGTLEMVFESCRAATLKWQSVHPGYGSGSTPMVRLVYTDGLGCL